MIGDVPYGAAAEPRYEHVIADINRYDVESTAHIGDTKSGSISCGARAEAVAFEARA